LRISASEYGILNQWRKYVEKMKKIGKEMGEQCISKVVVGMVLRMIQNVPEQGGARTGGVNLFLTR